MLKTNPLTQNEAIEIQREAEISSYESDLRFGQALFNALDAHRPDLAQRISGTSADPFYDDMNIQKFWRAVMEAR